MKKVLAFTISAIIACISIASATTTAPSPRHVAHPNWYTQEGYFVPAETIQQGSDGEVEHDYIVTDDGNVWAVDIDLPQGRCAVIFDNHGDPVVKNDSIVMVSPLEVA